MQTVASTITLFGKRRFRAHRLCGLLYLIQFALAVIAELFPPFSGLIPVLTVSLPATAFLQSCIASLTFTFLSRSNGQVQGYFSDKRTMSYEFVLENVYFSGLLFFQAVYFSYPNLFRKFLLFEILMVFFPYFIIRPFFPKTSFRDSIDNNKKEVTDRNQHFFSLSILFVKSFYLIAKFISGFFINYLIYTNSIPESHHRSIRILLLLGGWGTTISVFLHTLKFKGFLNPRLAMLLYTGSFPLFYIAYLSMYELMILNPLIIAISLIAILVNFLPQYMQILYQVLTFMMLHSLVKSR